MGTVPTHESDLTRFWAKVDKNGPVPEHRPELGPCWLWTAACHTNGYPAFRLDGKPRLAHIVSYEWFVGPLVNQACHHCDVKRCVRPEHLFDGTQKTNIQDAVAKGRMAAGERNGAYTHPERVLRGDQHSARLHPERMARGERSGRYTHPERTARGELHGSARLTEAQVLEIRRLFLDGGDRHEIAARFGVSLGAVDKIHHRRTWRHLP